MKKQLLVSVLMLVMFSVSGQTRPGTKSSGQSEVDKAMEESMKGMSEEDKTAMRKMMKGVMPDTEKKPGSDAVAFTDNKKLAPVRDAKRINRISQKIMTDADLSASSESMYGKLMTKIPSSEKLIITHVLSNAKSSAALMEAAVVSFMEGHNPAAIGLALKAVQADPKNVNYQNNLAAILSQSGYPEKAIPYLKKLSVAFPHNSSILHNLGYAWFSLGEMDTARRFFAYAAMRNPNNPETSLCRGVIEELKGDPKAAADNYVESFEQVPNPFSENLAKNVHAGDRLEKIDFDKMKSRIVIYEYFKKDWIEVPVLSDDVSDYEKDMRIKNGYSKMFDELNTKIDALAEAAGKETADLAEKGASEFVKTMMKENGRGVNMMSMPAVYVLKIIQAHIKKWNDNYRREYAGLMDTIREKENEITRADPNDKCPDFDKKNNAFLAYANPLIRKFHAKKIEECRVWLNAFCTWSWYVTGNPKNVVITQCVGWTGLITGMYRQAIEDQYAIAKSCVTQDGSGITHMNVPGIPNFACPAVVTIPVGLDELRLSAETINFDNNDWGIKQAEGSQTPNVTLSFGVDKNDITEPGKYGDPYAKTGNGSMNTSGVNYAGDNDQELNPLGKILDELTPFSKIPQDELTPLTKIPPDELAPLDPALLDKKGKLSADDFNKLKNAERARKLLKDLMSMKCPGEPPVKKSRKTKFTVGLGELELDPQIVVGLGELELWDDEVQGWVNSQGDPISKNHLTMQLGQLELLDVETNGLQTVINNGLEAVQGIKNYISGLFE